MVRRRAGSREPWLAGSAWADARQRSRSANFQAFWFCSFAWCTLLHFLKHLNNYQTLSPHLCLVGRHRHRLKLRDRGGDGGKGALRGGAALPPVVGPLRPAHPRPRVRLPLGRHAVAQPGGGVAAGGGRGGSSGGGRGSRGSCRLLATHDGSSRAAARAIKGAERCTGAER